MQDVIALGLGGLIGFAIVFCLGLVFLARPARARRQVQAPVSDPEILLCEGTVIDATPQIGLFLGERTLSGLTWADLRKLLQRRFEAIPDTLPDTTLRLDALGSRAERLTILAEGTRHRLVVHGLKSAGPETTSVDALEMELLRSASDLSPMPIWRTDEAGVVIWSNETYDAMLDLALGHDPSTGPLEISPDQLEREGTIRASFETRDGARRWFEVTTRPLEDGAMHFASAIDVLVEAEMAQRNFVQTLTKTFAHLPIGLAVFDRDRRLVLFNPALVDLTRLPVDFLSARPNLLSFFDHMRENRMMPEPKNYASWRDALGDVVSAARDDRYSETWNLPAGLTYKITGRPHPDGAVAFLLEDISAEISLTRRFRSELELSQSVLDRFEDAIVVFSQLGILNFCNDAYRSLWKVDPDSAFAESTIGDATRDWQARCDPSPIWPELREFVLTLRDRAAWSETLTLRDGHKVRCSVEPVAAGATLIRFTIIATPAPKVAQSTLGAQEID